MSIEKDLEQYDLHIEYAEEPEEPIDFEIRNEADELCATVWGSNPFDDVQIDCNHPGEVIDYHYDEDHHQGRCEICGAWCDVKTYTNYDDGYRVDESYAEEWYQPNRIGGIVGDYIQELREKW